MPAIIEHVLHQPRRQLALGIGAGQQLEIERVGLDLAAIPPPPVTLVGELEVGRLVLVVPHDVLADVLEHGRQLVFLAEPLEPQAEHRLGIDREMRAIAIQEAEHLVVASPGIGQDHEDQRVDVVGRRLERLDLADAVLEQLDLLGLVVREPGDASFEHSIGQLQVVLAGDLQAVDDQGRRVRRRHIHQSRRTSPSRRRRAACRPGAAMPAAAILATSAWSKTGLCS